MPLTGSIRDIWHESTGDNNRPCLGVEFVPDEPQTWANHPCFRTPFKVGDNHLKVGDRVTVPVHGVDGHATLADGTRLRMIGGLYDRNQPLR